MYPLESCDAAVQHNNSTEALCDPAALRLPSNFSPVGLLFADVCSLGIVLVVILLQIISKTIILQAKEK